ncbi:sensor histidine kinase [Labilibacter marinus]|uniref:sensor histidine kinase n=1 Tax=Labilibacter marinus TaxID=1477105 RepID=UPI00095030BD|nr:ATP-binding protein [Labilibacter marinus]
MEQQLKEINTVYDRILNNGLLFGTILGAFVYSISWITFYSVELYFSYITDAVVLLSFFLVYFFKKRISFKYKTIVIVLGIIGLVVPDLLKLGLMSENKVLLILIPLFTYLAFDIKRTIAVYLLVILIFMTCGYMVVNQMLFDYPEMAPHQMQLTTWLVNILLMSVVSVIFVILVKQFHATFYGLINDLKKTNKELSISEENYRKIFNSAVDAIFIQDTKGNVVDVNDAMLEMYGYKREEMGLINLERASAPLPEYSQEKVIEHFKRAVEKGKAVFDWMARKKDGTLFWVEVALRLTKIGDEERILAVVRDNDEKKKNAIQLEVYKEKLQELVLEQTNELKEANEELLVTNNNLNNKNEELSSAYDKLKNAQERMIQSEKLASLGLLAAGVAHEINNPLNFIQGGAVGLENYFKNNYSSMPADIEDILFAINEGVRRSATIVDSLSHFSKGSDADKKEKCELHEIIEHCLVILNNKYKNRITIVKDCTSDNRLTNCNEGQLHQVFLNILSNSVHAIKGEGEIKLSSKVEGAFITVTIADNGCGMDNETLTQVTEPFFTTKVPGEGTGLGMSITSNIIAEHQGQLSIHSELGKGTIVRVSLPFLSN